MNKTNTIKIKWKKTRAQKGSGVRESMQTNNKQCSTTLLNKNEMWMQQWAHLPTVKYFSLYICNFGQTTRTSSVQIACFVHYNLYWRPSLQFDEHMKISLHEQVSCKRYGIECRPKKNSYFTVHAWIAWWKGSLQLNTFNYMGLNALPATMKPFTRQFKNVIKCSQF